ncbi:MAG TPA: OmpA family protein [Hyphomonadaceae bacterium]|nr:OmpA family protein [Hyphomonadaceae bacterium]
MGKQLAIRSLAVGVAGVLLTLVIGAWFGPNSAGQIEHRVQAAANSALTSLGLVEWRATANGQSVELEGVAPSDPALEGIVAAVKSASGVTDVRTDNVDIVPLAKPFSWSAYKENGRIVLEGVAPSRESLKAIHAAARKLYGSDMSNMMTLASGAPAGVEWDVAVIAGLEALAKLKHGSAQLSGDRLVVMGLAENELDAEIVRNTLSHARVGVTAVAEVLGPPDWIASVERGRITFQGKVVSETAKRALERAAGGASRTNDKSYIASTGDWEARAVAALPYLARFDQGEISVRGNRFRISGEAAGHLIGDLKNAMSKIADGFVVDYQLAEAQPEIPEIASLDLTHGADAETCQKAFDRITDADRIDFASNRSDLGRSNGSVLDKLVFLARTCEEYPLEIQGFTDNRGQTSKNKALSLARATAVKDYLVARGLSANRLTALGFGPERPVASNETETGRAQNRRIEFEVVRGE